INQYDEKSVYKTSGRYLLGFIKESVMSFEFICHKYDLLVVDECSLSEIESIQFSVERLKCEKEISLVFLTQAKLSNLDNQFHLIKCSAQFDGRCHHHRTKEINQMYDSCLDC